jgi:hypothetical protein
MASAAILMAVGLTGCKSVTERYIALEVWKYEKCFGHLPPGFVPPGAAAAPAMQPCGQPAACSPAPCQSASFAPGEHAVAGNCNDCQGGVVSGGMPAGGTVVPSLPAGPGGSPGPMPTGMSASKPVIISDEVVLP